MSYSTSLIVFNYAPGEKEKVDCGDQSLWFERLKYKILIFNIKYNLTRIRVFLELYLIKYKQRKLNKY